MAIEDRLGLVKSSRWVQCLHALRSYSINASLESGNVAERAPAERLCGFDSCPLRPFCSTTYRPPSSILYPFHQVLTFARYGIILVNRNVAGH